MTITFGNHQNSYTATRRDSAGGDGGSRTERSDRAPPTRLFSEMFRPVRQAGRDRSPSPSRNTAELKRYKTFVYNNIFYWYAGFSH